MIITKETQEKMIAEYSQGKSTEQIIAFLDGMNAAFNLTDKMLKDEIERV